MYSDIGDTAYPCRVSPFGNRRIYRCLLLPGDYRRRTASFIGSNDQGIPHAPLFSFALALLVRETSLLRDSINHTLKVFKVRLTNGGFVASLSLKEEWWCTKWI